MPEAARLRFEAGAARDPWLADAPTMVGRSALRVVSWNVHQCVGVDGRYAPGRIARILTGLAPDVVGLQEVDTGKPPFEALHQLDYIARATGLAAVAGFNIRHPNRDYGNALLTRLPLGAVRRIDLSAPRREPRGALDVELEAPDGPLRVVVTHLGLNAKERRFQAGRIGRALAAHDAGARTLLLGDFNEWFPSLTRRLDAATAGFPGAFAGPSFPSPAPFLALDRIHARPAPARSAFRVWRRWPAPVASDHLPIVLDLEWT